jgi:hypothetical protein
MRLATRRLHLAAVPLIIGCSTPPPPIPTVTSVLLAHDDNRVEGTIAFPNLHHESVVRFELPPGSHKLRRLWVQAGAAGTLRYAFYDQTPLEGPGLPWHEGKVVIVPEAISSGHDGRWVYEDLSALPARDGVIWLGFKRLEGEPTIAACRADAGQYFVRSHDPTNPMNLLPVKRTPMVRLEVAP